jgi:tetratricopeptide (TPR) repeat protein
VLAWRVLRALNVPGAWVAALLFGVHPVHVESVAWVTERKNLLSGALYLAAALHWLRFTHRRESGEPAWKTWWLALALFACALLSKTVTASLPAVLLLVAWWKHGALRRRDLQPLIPFFLVGLALSAVTVFVERQRVGALGPAFDLDLLQRFCIAGRALWFYVGKLAWPSTLMFMYPRWDVASMGATDLVPWVGFVAVVGITWWQRHRLTRAPTVALLAFSGSLFPALGFINVFPMKYTFVADHYVYLASLPLLALGVAGASALLSRARVSTRSTGFIVGGLAATLGMLSNGHALKFRNEETLWRDTIEENPGAWQARTNLATVLMGRGELPEAETQLRAALEDNPRGEWTLNNLGLVLAAQGDLPGAIQLYRRAVTEAPQQPEIHLNLGLALARIGQPSEGKRELTRALELRPGYARAAEELARLGNTTDP